MPPLLSVAYAQSLMQSLPPRLALPALVALVVSVALLASYAHTVNDIFDVDSDARAGKANSVARLGGWGRVSRSAVLLVAGLTPWVFHRPPGPALAALVAIVLLPLAYSAPPLRLKERGVAGLLADAAVAHVAPTVFVSMMFAGLAPNPRSGTLLLVLLASAWAACVGLRGILVHQLHDLDNDLLGGTRTFVVEAGVERARRLCTRVLFPVEVCLLGVLLVVLTRLHALVGGFFLLYAIVFQLARCYWLLPHEPAPIERHRTIAMFEFYTVWPPVVLGIALAFRQPIFALLVVVHVIFFGRSTLRQVRSIVSLTVPFVKMSGLTVLRPFGFRRDRYEDSANEASASR